MPTVSDEEMARWELAEEVIRRAVKRGVRSMEEHEPGFLANGLELADLEIDSPCGCVLGQWYTTMIDPDPEYAFDFDPFSTACMRFDLSTVQSQLLGFDRPRVMLMRLNLEDMETPETWWRVLQSEWVSQILTLRDQLQDEQ